MKRLIHFLSPLERLGEKNYSIVFPLIVNILVILASETYAYVIAKDPMAVGAYIIFIDAAVLIYFAFRDGIRGGIISAVTSIIYYFYIIYTRNYQGQQFESAVITTLVLGTIYLLVGTIIGWLKQRIDHLIENEADGRRRLETILEQLPVGIIITDSSGRLVQRNKQLDQILGVKIPIGFQMGKDTLEKEKINNQPIDPSQSPLATALKTGKPVLNQSFTFERRDGKILYLQVNSTPIFNAKKKAIAAATIVNDITQQKELEKQKDDFLGIASHELKTPVTSIKAYAQVLQAQFNRRGDQDSVEKLKKLDSQINKLTNLIGDLLDVTKIRAGKLEYRREDFDFNSLIEEVVDELRLTSGSHTLTTKLSKTATIHADREREGQVLTNLITNAIKYSPSKGKVIISTTIKKSKVNLSVKDFGVGIPKNKQKRVFEQFFRVSGDRQITFPGLGLGLYISSEIVKREGGKIWVESIEGRGSTFWFSLPIKKN